MRPHSIIKMLTAFSGLGAEPEGETPFSKLSEEAQDAIVTVMVGGEAPQDLPDTVKEEIRQWAYPDPA